jgi:hypothetical protein
VPQADAARPAGDRRRLVVRGLRRDLRGTVEEPVLRRHEWEIAVGLREITELLLDLVSSAGGGTAGPMTATVLVSQNRAISMARDATTARVLTLRETLQLATLAAEALALPELRQAAAAGLSRR